MSEPLMPDETEGFPELVTALHDALADLLGEQFDIDYPVLATELADTAWKHFRGSRVECIDCGVVGVDGPDDEGFLDCRACGAAWVVPGKGEEWHISTGAPLPLHLTEAGRPNFPISDHEEPS